MLNFGVGTCNLACWEAREDVCRCMCGGRNHGITRLGAKAPGRFCRRKGGDFRLEGIYASYVDADHARANASDEVSLDNGDKPLYVRDGVSHWYSRDEYAFCQYAPAHARKWPEVKAFMETHPNRREWLEPEAYLVWKRTLEFQVNKEGIRC